MTDTDLDAFAVRRWEVPIDDRWHRIPAGQITAIGCTRSHDKIDVWVASHGIRQDTRIVRVYGTGHPVELKRPGVIGTVVTVPAAFMGLSGPPGVWHLIEDTARETESR